MSDNTTGAGAPHEPPFKDGASSFGSFYPKHYVLAVFADDAAATRAADALRSAGFAADDVVQVPGAEFVEHARDARAGQGALTRLREKWSRLYTDDADASQRLVDLAGQGAAFVLAYAPDDAASTRAAAAVQGMQPAVLRYYGGLAVTDLR